MFKGLDFDSIFDGKTGRAVQGGLYRKEAGHQFHECVGPGICGMVVE